MSLRLGENLQPPPLGQDEPLEFDFTSAAGKTKSPPADAGDKSSDATEEFFGAVQEGDEAKVDQLLKDSGTSGLNINAVNSDGDNALHIAARADVKNEGIVRIITKLADAGVDLSLVNKAGKSAASLSLDGMRDNHALGRRKADAIFNSMERQFIRSVKEGTEDRTIALLDNMSVSEGAPWQLSDSEVGPKLSTLMFAAGNQNARTVKAILKSLDGVPDKERKAYINQQGPNGNTALHAAVRDKETYDALVDAGADETVKNTDGDTPDQMREAGLSKREHTDWWDIEQNFWLNVLGIGAILFNDGLNLVPTGYGGQKFEPVEVPDIMVMPVQVQPQGGRPARLEDDTIEGAAQRVVQAYSQVTGDQHELEFEQTNDFRGVYIRASDEPDSHTLYIGDRVLADFGSPGSIRIADNFILRQLRSVEELLSSRNGSLNLRYLANNEVPVIIRPAAFDGGAEFDHYGMATVGLNGGDGIQNPDFPWETARQMPNSMILHHELAHMVYHHSNEPPFENWEFPHLNGETMETVPFDEALVVGLGAFAHTDGTENALRREWGLMERPFYSDEREVAPDGGWGGVAPPSWSGWAGEEFPDHWQPSFETDEDFLGKRDGGASAEAKDGFEQVHSEDDYKDKLQDGPNIRTLFSSDDNFDGKEIRITQISTGKDMGILGQYVIDVEADPEVADLARKDRDFQLSLGRELDFMEVIGSRFRDGDDLSPIMTQAADDWLAMAKPSPDEIAEVEAALEAVGKDWSKEALKVLRETGVLGEDLTVIEDRDAYDDVMNDGDPDTHTIIDPDDDPSDGYVRIVQFDDHPGWSDHGRVRNQYVFKVDDDDDKRLIGEDLGFQKQLGAHYSYEDVFQMRFQDDSSLTAANREAADHYLRTTQPTADEAQAVIEGIKGQVWSTDGLEAMLESNVLFVDDWQKEFDRTNGTSSLKGNMETAVHAALYNQSPRVEDQGYENALNAVAGWFAEGFESREAPEMNDTIKGHFATIARYNLQAFSVDEAYQHGFDNVMSALPSALADRVENALKNAGVDRWVAKPFAKVVKKMLEGAKSDEGKPSDIYEAIKTVVQDEHSLYTAWTDAFHADEVGS